MCVQGRTISRGGRDGLTLRTFICITCSVVLALYLLFWFLESIGPRMEIINKWTVESCYGTQRISARAGITRPLVGIEATVEVSGVIVPGGER